MMGFVAGQMRVSASEGGPIQFIGTTIVSQGSQGSAAGLSLPMPAGAQVGDFAVLLIQSYNARYNPTLSGWTKGLSPTGTEIKDRRYRVLNSLNPIALPAHNSRFLARLMVFRNVPAGSSLVVHPAVGTGTTANGSLTIPESSMAYPAGAHYLLPLMYNNATTAEFKVDAPYPYDEAVTQHVTPPTSAHSALATCGCPWAGDGVIPAQTWNYSSGYSSWAHVVLIKAPG